MNNNRVDKFHGNVAAWKSIADIQIDYFTQYVKAWIPFNAWFSTTYQNENSDRDILSKVKKENNPFKDKIIQYLTRAGGDSESFKEHLCKLHYELEKNPIPSVSRCISFTRIILEKNLLPSFFNWVEGRGYKYKVIVTYNHSAVQGSQKINVQVMDVLVAVNQSKMNWNQNDWDIDELKEHSQYKLQNISRSKVRLEIQKEIINCYQQINPLKPTNLVIPPKRKNSRIPIFVEPENCIVINSEKKLYFDEDPEKIAKGLIEVLYNLRNALFHGEISPSDEVQKVYKEAYYVLYPLLKSLS